MTPKPEPVDVNEVRSVIERVELDHHHWRYWECEGPVNAMTDGKMLARFARAVLEPPREVAEAVEHKRSIKFIGGAGMYSVDGHSSNQDNKVIADYYLSLTAPTAPETP